MAEVAASQRCYKCGGFNGSSYRRLQLTGEEMRQSNRKTAWQFLNAAII
jgi:hypothetical protein